MRIQGNPGTPATLGRVRRAAALREWIGDWLAGGLDLLFPPRCVFCGREPAPEGLTLPLCSDCESALRVDERRAFCQGCGMPRQANLPRAVRCLECRRRKFRFHQVVPLGVYEGELRRATVRMKQFHEYPLTAAVGQLLTERLAEQLSADRPQSVVPIPKFWLKRVVRGTNTSEVLAETIGSGLAIPVALRALKARKATRKQSLLGRGERQRNVSGSLRLARGIEFRQRHVLIVDDIMTTGATCNEAARVLVKAGARRITVAVAARAIGEFR